MDSLSEEQLHVVCMDFLLPATTAAAAVLNFAMAFLLNYPEVQTKMQEELDTEVGRDRLPTLNDRARLAIGDAIPS
jgi:cytochrome P450